MSKAAELAALIANVNKGSSLGSKNFVINGAQNVAQRGTSSTGIGASSGYFTTDRLYLSVGNTAGRLTMEQVADGPSGFANCTKLSCTTADTSIASNEFLVLSNALEGQDLQSLKKGTANAVPITVSFYVKGNASATYTVELRDTDNSRRNSQEFSVTTDWTRVEKTFVGDTTGTLDDDNARSLVIQIFLHAGSDFTGGTHTDDVWHTTANQVVGDSNTSFFDSTDRTFFMTGLQMEIGEKATEFEHESYDATLKKCLRYHYEYTTSGLSDMPAYFISPYSPASHDGSLPNSSGFLTVVHPVPMRAVPSHPSTTVNSGSLNRDTATIYHTVYQMSTTAADNALSVTAATITAEL